LLRQLRSLETQSSVKALTQAAAERIVAKNQNSSIIG